MYYIGVDWADDHHDIFISNESGEKVDSFRITHDHEGITLLRDKIRSLSVSKEQVLFAIETHKNLLVDFLLDEGFTVYSINPKSVARYRDRYRVSGAKDDIFDAMVLSNIIRTDISNYKPIMPNSQLARELKILTQDEQRLVHLKTRMINQIQNCLKDYYPVALTLFNDIDRTITMEFLLKYPVNQKPSLKELRKFLRKHHCPNTDEKATEIYDKLCAEQLFVEEFTVRAKSRMLVTLVEQLKMLVFKLDEYKKEINRLFEQHQDSDIFKSLPGSGGKTAPRLLSEFGDNRERFSDKNEIQCYAGTAPVTKRSGKALTVRVRYSCRKQFRNIIYQYAFTSLRSSAWAKSFYDCQRAKGNSHTKALRALGNKWLKIIYSLWKNNELYNEDRHLADIMRSGYASHSIA
jgi:transposase